MKVKSIHERHCVTSVSRQISPFTFHQGFVHPLQDVALHQYFALSSSREILLLIQFPVSCFRTRWPYSTQQGANGPCLFSPQSVQGCPPTIKEEQTGPAFLSTVCPKLPSNTQKGTDWPCLFSLPQSVQGCPPTLKEKQ